MEPFRDDRTGKSVLVVDDDAEARDRLKVMLEREGWSVKTAENGRVALDVLESAAPSLIMLDLMMPEMDGFTFLNELRSIEQRRGIPVIVLTAKDITADDRQRLEGPGFPRHPERQHELAGSRRRGAIPGVRRAYRAVRRASARERVDLHRAFAADLDQAAAFAGERIAERVPHRGGHPDLARFRRSL